VRSLRVVGLVPDLRDLAQLVERVKEMRVQHLLGIAAVEPLNEGVLVRLSWLDVADRDLVAVHHSSNTSAVSSPSWSAPHFAAHREELRVTSAR
jgi:hypothetical protein